MQNKLLKVIFILIVFVMTSIFPMIVFASDSTTSWVKSAKSFLSSSDENINVDPVKVREISNSIYNLLSSIGMVISVIVGIVLGIQFMVASAEDKAKVKEALLPYVTGCIIIFGAFGIWKLLINTFGGI